MVNEGVSNGRRFDELAERILQSLAGDVPAGGLLPRDRAQRWRSPALDAGNLLFLTVIGIVGLATAGSLFAAGFLLLMHPKAALRPAALNAMRAQPAPSRVLVVAAAASIPSRVSAKAAPAPHAAEAPRIAPAASPPPTAAMPLVTPPPPAARPPPATARFAMAQGDSNFGDGEVSVARFYYAQAADAGDAEAAVRMGETFDPAFCTLDRLCRVRGDPAAARFWYRRALVLGAAQAKQRLDYLEAEPAADGSTTNARSDRYRPRAVAAQRYDRPAFQRILEQILHPSPPGG
jgi:TPR repeat protein